MKKWEIIGSGNSDLSNYYNKSETYNKSEVDSKISSSGSFNPALYYPKTEVYNKTEINKELDKKANQDYIMNQFNITNANVTDLSKKVSDIDNKISSDTGLKNVNATISYMPSNMVTLEIPSENWKSIQNFYLNNITNYINIMTREEPVKSGLLTPPYQQHRCISGLIFFNKTTDDKIVTIDSPHNPQIVKVGDFADNTYKKGINILSYFYFNGVVYIVKVA